VIDWALRVASGALYVAAPTLRPARLPTQVALPAHYDAGIGAVIVYVPRDQRGRDILDEVDGRTDEDWEPSDYAPDARQYTVLGEQADARAFEPTLESVDPAWRDHVTPVSLD